MPTGRGAWFSVFYYCGFLGWAAGCLIMIKTIIILHHYALPSARLGFNYKDYDGTGNSLFPCWGAVPKGLEIRSEVVTAASCRAHPGNSPSALRVWAHHEKQRVLLSCPHAPGSKAVFMKQMLSHEGVQHHGIPGLEGTKAGGIIHNPISYL